VPAQEIVEMFWEAMRANDWERAAGVFAADAVIDWPCTGERMRSPSAWAELQARYPAAGRWTFEIHRLIVDGDTAVTEFTASDGDVSARAISFAETAGDSIVRLVEYWIDAYDPPNWRSDLVDRIDQIP
jgi:ketosteroid isomerase-like protein